MPPACGQATSQPAVSAAAALCAVGAPAQEDEERERRVAAVVVGHHQHVRAASEARVGHEAERRPRHLAREATRPQRPPGPALVFAAAPLRQRAALEHGARERDEGESLPGLFGGGGGVPHRPLRVGAATGQQRSGARGRSVLEASQRERADAGVGAAEQPLQRRDGDGHVVAVGDTEREALHLGIARPVEQAAEGGRAQGRRLGEVDAGEGPLDRGLVRQPH
jgi:hypothetical protein